MIDDHWAGWSVVGRLRVWWLSGQWLFGLGSTVGGLVDLIKPMLPGILESLQYFLSFKMCSNESNNHTFTLFSEATSIFQKYIFQFLSKFI